MRKLLFWMHLVIGCAAGVVILMMSITGVLLTYEQQMIEWADREYRSVPAGNRLPPQALLESVARAGLSADALTLRSAADAPAEVTVGPRIVYVDAYSGRVVGEGSAGIRSFFRSVTSWHRWFALEGPGRQFGRSITGASNLIFLVLAVSGLYLWLPRKWGWKNIRAVLLFRGGLSGKARDFNWHNVIGIWCAVPLIFVILGALVISYPWATALVYRAAGNEPPATTGRPAGPPGARRSDAVALAGLDQAWKQAETLVPGWQSVTWRASGGKRITLAIAESHRGRVDLRSTLVVDRETGNVQEHEKFSDFNRGRQWRSWLRFIHTGEALGLPGQTIAGIASAGGAVLVWTGLALAWRRFTAWRSRRNSASKPDLQPAARAS